MSTNIDITLAKDALEISLIGSIALEKAANFEKQAQADAAVRVKVAASANKVAKALVDAGSYRPSDQPRLAAKLAADGGQGAHDIIMALIEDNTGPRAGAPVKQAAPTTPAAPAMRQSDAEWFAKAALRPIV